MFDWHLMLGYISGTLAIVAVVPYIKDILKGSTRPNIVSWALWVLILTIAMLAQINAGTSLSLVFLIGDLIGTSIVFILCLVGYGYKDYGWIEWTCLGLAIVAIVSWQLTSIALLAIVFSVLADLMASVPTVVKAVKDPWSEHPTQWLIICSASLLGIFSSRIFNLVNILFPAYLLFINGLIGLSALFGRLKHDSRI